MPVCQEVPLCLSLKCEVKQTLLKKENTGRNTSIQIWGVSKAEQEQNWSKAETSPWVDTPTVLFSWWNLNFPEVPLLAQLWQSLCVHTRPGAALTLAHTCCSFSGYFSYPVSSALVFVSQFFWCRSRNSSLMSLPQVPRLVTYLLASGCFCNT